MLSSLGNRGGVTDGMFVGNHSGTESAATQSINLVGEEEPIITPNRGIGAGDAPQMGEAPKTAKDRLNEYDEVLKMLRRKLVPKWIIEPNVRYLRRKFDWFNDHHQSLLSLQLANVDPEVLNAERVWRFTGLAIGSFLLFIGPFMISLGSKREGDTKAGLQLSGTILTALPLLATLIKKGGILRLKLNIEADIEATQEAAHQLSGKAKREQLRKAEMLRYVLNNSPFWPYILVSVANFVTGSIIGFPHELKLGALNALPELLEIPLATLLIFVNEVLGSREFPNATNVLDVLDVPVVAEPEVPQPEVPEPTRAVLEKKMYEMMFQGWFILAWCGLTVSTHVTMITIMVKRYEAEGYIDKAGLPVLVNFLISAFCITRLNQQIVACNLSAHILAQYQCEYLRTDLLEKELAAHAAVATEYESDKVKDVLSRRERLLEVVNSNLSKVDEKLKARRGTSQNNELEGQRRRHTKLRSGYDKIKRIAENCAQGPRTPPSPGAIPPSPGAIPPEPNNSLKIRAKEMYLECLVCAYEGYKFNCEGLDGKIQKLEANSSALLAPYMDGSR